METTPVQHFTKHWQTVKCMGIWHKQPNGRYIEDEELRALLLLKTHFSSSRPIELADDQHTKYYYGTPSRANWEVTKEVFTPQRLKWAIESFQPFQVVRGRQHLTHSFAEGSERNNTALSKDSKGLFIIWLHTKEVEKGEDNIHPQGRGRDVTLLNLDKSA